MLTPLSQSRRAMIVLWPAFLMAGVLEALVFVVVDPADLRWFGGPVLGWSSQAVYTVTFLIIWATMSAACALSSWLWLDAVDIDERDVARAPGPR